MNWIETTPIKTWQFYLSLKKIFGRNYLTDLYKKSPRQMDRWACDPDYTAQPQQNPIDKYERNLLDLMEIGKERIARGCVDRQVRIVGCTMRDSSPVSDKSTIEEELLDNLPALAEYQEVARPDANQPLSIIREKAQALIREIEEDVVLIEQTRRYK